MINSQISALAPFLQNSPNLFNANQSSPGGLPLAQAPMAALPVAQPEQLFGTGVNAAPKQQGQQDGAGTSAIMKLLGTKDGGGSDMLMQLLSSFL